ncbi:MAG: DUF4399 domain-containing protein [Nitrospinota bacterium]|nr:DUF4399 domain-containing protein [Nitrospinota bacterium]
MRKLAIVGLVTAVMLASGVASADLLDRIKNTDFVGGLKSPPGAKVYIISPKNGETVKNPVLIQFGLKVMGVAPAQIRMENTGHHHLLINKSLLQLDLNRPLPDNDSRIKHFDNGETEMLAKFPPGVYKLRAIFGNFNHMTHDPPVMSEEITINVE